MKTDYRKVNEVLARRSVSSVQGDLKKELDKAEKYLKSGKGEKPEWLDDFFNSNRDILKQTIIRAITPEVDGIKSLSGYNNGYFNEIIQNANDLHAGDTINFKVSKGNSVYSMECVYKDNGFTLSNIYAFLNREMSDKSSKEGQTGQFGVGIKSFFKFVKKFRVESNVIFSFVLDRKTAEVTECEVCENKFWDGQSTILYFEYEENDVLPDSGFNTKKLSNFIDYLDDYTDDDVSRFFVSGCDTELIFDIRSIIFININSNKVNFSNMNFSGKSHSVTIKYEEINDVQEIYIESIKWIIRNVCLKINVDNKTLDLKKYVVFTQGKISLGFPINDNLDGLNRFYSTYYIKEDTNSNIFPLGMIVNTEETNIYRNDLGNNEKSIHDAYKNIKETLVDLFEFMSSDKIVSAKCLDDISDIFHLMLFRCITKHNQDSKAIPFDIEKLDNQYLPKISGDNRRDIVVHKVEEEFQKSTYSDKESISDVTEAYYKIIEKDNVIDYYELMNSSKALNGVLKLYKFINDVYSIENEIYWNYAVALNYFHEVAEYITFVVSGAHKNIKELSDLEVDLWLCKLDNERYNLYDFTILLKIIGRYRLNKAIAFNGSLINENLSFHDYLFNGIPELKNGILAKLQNQEFDCKFLSLKQQLMANRLYERNTGNYKIRCIAPKGKSRTRWDYETLDCQRLSVNNSFVSEDNKFLLLKKLAEDSSLINYTSVLKNLVFQTIKTPYGNITTISPTYTLFEECPVILAHRENPYEYSYVSRVQQMISLYFLKNINTDNFNIFIKAVDYRRRIRLKNINEKFEISISCCQNSITTNDIEKDLLPNLVSINVEDGKKAYLLKEYDPNNVLIEKIEENTSNDLPEKNKNFIFSISGYNFFVRRFVSNSKKHMIAYFGNGMAKISTSADGNFKPMVKFNSTSKDVYIFYDNILDIKTVLAKVLDELKVKTFIQDLVKGYIHNGNNTIALNYLSRYSSMARVRTFARIRKKLEIEWSDISSDSVFDIDDIEVIYRLLTSRGSYDIYCPICSDIPIETFYHGEDTKKKRGREIIVMENENKETKLSYPYIITVGCSYCYEKLRNTLVNSEFDGKHITLTTQIAQGQHEKMRKRQQIELSPINIKIMQSVKLEKIRN